MWDPGFGLPEQGDYNGVNCCEIVDKTRGVSHEMPDPDGPVRRPSFWRSRGASFPDPHVSKRRYELAHRVVQLKEPLFEAHHRGNGGDRLGHRIDTEESVDFDRSTCRVACPVRLAIGDLASTAHEDEPTGEPPVVHVGPEMGADPLQPPWVETDLYRVNLVGY
jgi:hypothetical protein